MKKTNVKKILFIFITILVGITVFISNMFFGNPVSKWLAQKAGKDYISRNYKDLELEEEKVFYNFKNGCYTIDLQDKNSIDTKFEIAFDSLGKFRYDTFEDRNFNTERRFDDAVREYGKKIEKQYNTNYEIILSTLNMKNSDKRLNLDQEVDFNNFPLKISGSIIAFADKPSYEEADRLLKELNSIMENEPIGIVEYSIILIPEKDRAKGGEAQTWKNALSIYNIPKEVVESGDAGDLKKYYK